MFAKTYAKLLAFFFPNGVYLPAVLVFEVLIPDKRPPLLRDGVRQWRRGMYEAVLVCFGVYACLFSHEIPR